MLAVLGFHRMVYPYFLPSHFDVVGGQPADAERLAAATTPDVILMDVRLKGPRDSIDIARIVRQRHQVPIVFVCDATELDATLARP